jgi:hypothetical protein
MPNYGPKIVTDGLVLALDAANKKSYPGSGTTWTDLSDSVAVGTWSTTPTFSTNNIGIFQVVSSGPRLNFTELPLTDTTNFTIFIWGNFQTYVGTVRPRFISLAQSGINLQFGHNEEGRNNQLYLRYNDVLYAANELLPNEWAQYVVRKNDSVVEFYRNATLLTTISTTVPTANATSNFIAGYNTTSSNTLSGFIGQVLYYQKPLNQAEILQNFNATRSRYGV